MNCTNAVSSVMHKLMGCSEEGRIQTVKAGGALGTTALISLMCRTWVLAGKWNVGQHRPWLHWHTCA
jgi:hypothetical protein